MHGRGSAPEFDDNTRPEHASKPSKPIDASTIGPGRRRMAHATSRKNNWLIHVMVHAMCDTTSASRHMTCIIHSQRTYIALYCITLITLHIAPLHMALHCITLFTMHHNYNCKCNLDLFRINLIGFLVSELT